MATTFTVTVAQRRYEARPVPSLGVYRYQVWDVTSAPAVFVRMAYMWRQRTPSGLGTQWAWAWAPPLDAKETFGSAAALLAKGLPTEAAA